MSAVESSLVKAVRDHGCCFRLSVQHPYNVTDKRKNRVRGEANFYINSGRRDNEILLSWYSPEDGKSLMSLRRKFREAGLVEARR